ncbi:uncharacterized protein LOC133297644 [Gastrolobium bilobum]|uniref:uncharacterized protein LOC133297644 n=1 Tax=Gastrolobium bilobum TaxID=150636 RepID=UPI002AB06616|nr:uncharacterized protein LOC133297644 [Gastrolobium bilobum]
MEDAASAPTQRAVPNQNTTPAPESNPYYLHPNESSSLVLVSPSMNGKYFHTWQRSMRMALLSKNKLGFVNGTIKKPGDGSPLFGSWERCNTMIISWLNRSIAQSVLWMEKADDIWNNLKDRFAQTDMFRISVLQDEIFKLQQGYKCVSDYFTQLKILWDELESLQPILPSCACGAATQVKDTRERDYLERRLKIGVQDSQSFINIAEQKNSRGQLDRGQTRYHPNFNQNFNHGFNQGRGQGFNQGRGQGFNQGRGRGNKFCTYCKRTNHTIETCYLKHGFPPGYQTRRPYVAAAAATNFVSLEFDDSVHNTDPEPEPESLNLAFSKEQHQEILELLQRSKLPHSSNMIQTHSSAFNIGNTVSGIKSNHWILDTGATDHMTYIFSNLSCVQSINPIHITLPNGTQITTTQSGTARISDSLVLKNVLYISTNKTIGSAKQLDGLYILKTYEGSVKKSFCNKVNSNDALIWHQRLGHPSEPVMKTIKMSTLLNLVYSLKSARLPAIEKKIDKDSWKKW